MSEYNRFINYSMPEPNTGCWLWMGHTNPSNYGNMWFNGTTEKAHRVSWILHNGPIPRGLSVLHRCDMPCCVNPSHLFLGTHKDNMQDMVGKGRHHSQIPGSHRDYGRKLTEDQAREIKSLCHREGMSRHKLAAKFNVHRSTISRLVSGKYWGHL